MKTLKVKKEDIQKYIKAEAEELANALTLKHDSLLIVLKFHLLVENFIERIILAVLARGDRLLEKGNLSFFQKLYLIHSFDIINDSIIQAIIHLNSLRNRHAHNKGHKLSVADIDLIGRPLGKKYTEIKKKCLSDIDKLLTETFMAIFTEIITEVAFLEFDNETEKEEKKQIT